MSHFTKVWSESENCENDFENTFLFSDSMMMKRTLSTEIAESFKHLKIIEHKPFVYNVQMNREKKMNALNKQLWW